MFPRKTDAHSINDTHIVGDYANVINTFINLRISDYCILYIMLKASESELCIAPLKTIHKFSAFHAKTPNFGFY